ncbi:MAG TPA: hypothetical protein VIY51_16205 [Xanthobacteraceae bacterium]
MDPFFAFIEHSDLAELIRGSDSLLAFPAIITLHAIGMGFLAGGSTAIDLRILGVARGIPLKAMAGFLPLLWLAFAINAVSGTLLLIAYPTKALTNPLFYVKLCLIALGVGLVYRIGNTVLRAPDAEQKLPGRNAKALALASIATWVALILAGRFLAYTHRWELLGVPAVL